MHVNDFQATERRLFLELVKFMANTEAALTFFFARQVLALVRPLAPWLDRHRVSGLEDEMVCIVAAAASLGGPMPALPFNSPTILLRNRGSAPYLLTVMLSKLNRWELLQTLGGDLPVIPSFSSDLEARHPDLNAAHELYLALTTISHFMNLEHGGYTNSEHQLLHGLTNSARNLLLQTLSGINTHPPMPAPGIARFDAAHTMMPDRSGGLVLEHGSGSGPGNGATTQLNPAAAVSAEPGLPVSMGGAAASFAQAQQQQQQQPQQHQHSQTSTSTMQVHVPTPPTANTQPPPTDTTWTTPANALAWQSQRAPDPPAFRFGRADPRGLAPPHHASTTREEARENMLRQFRASRAASQWSSWGSPDPAGAGVAAATG